jgi:hypothetical protein
MIDNWPRPIALPSLPLFGPIIDTDDPSLTTWRILKEEARVANVTLEYDFPSRAKDRKDIDDARFTQSTNDGHLTPFPVEIIVDTDRLEPILTKLRTDKLEPKVQ